MYGRYHGYYEIAFQKNLLLFERLRTIVPLHLVDFYDCDLVEDACV